jgi:hypothetical protein
MNIFSFLKIALAGRSGRNKSLFGNGVNGSTGNSKIYNNVIVSHSFIIYVMQLLFCR